MRNFTTDLTRTNYRIFYELTFVIKVNKNIKTLKVEFFKTGFISLLKNLFNKLLNVKVLFIVSQNLGKNKINTKTLIQFNERKEEGSKIENKFIIFKKNFLCYL